MQFLSPSTAALRRLPLQTSQEREQLGHIPIPPGFPLLGHGAGERLRQRPQHLIHVRRDHVLFDLFPMLQSLDLRPNPVQFIGPSKEVARRHALPAVRHGRRKTGTILLFKRRHGPALFLERGLRLRQRHIGQPDDPPRCAGIAFKGRFARTAIPARMASSSSVRLLPGPVLATSAAPDS